MSSSFTDPNDSQNESETNFVTGHMMEVEDDAPSTAETQLGDEEQFIVNLIKMSQLLMQNGLLTTMKRGENKKIDWKCLGVGLKDV